MWLEVELTAAHEKFAFGVGADVFAFLVDHFRVTDGAEVPPVFFGFFLRG